MNTLNIYNWIQGYLESLNDGNKITKKQLERLVVKVTELIDELEEEYEIFDDGVEVFTPINKNNPKEDDDLPF